MDVALFSCPSAPYQSPTSLPRCVPRSPFVTMQQQQRFSAVAVRANFLPAAFTGWEAAMLVAGGSRARSGHVLERLCGGVSP